MLLTIFTLSAGKTLFQCIEALLNAFQLNAFDRQIDDQLCCPQPHTRWGVGLVSDRDPGLHGGRAFSLRQRQGLLHRLPPASKAALADPGYLRRLNHCLAAQKRWYGALLPPG
jgi:hypothetical protein